MIERLLAAAAIALATVCEILDVASRAIAGRVRNPRARGAGTAGKKV